MKAAAARQLPEWRRLLELERLIGATPPATPAGARAQLRFALTLLDEYRDLACHAERALRGGVAALDRLAGEARRG